MRAVREDCAKPAAGLVRWRLAKTASARRDPAEGRTSTSEAGRLTRAFSFEISPPRQLPPRSIRGISLAGCGKLSKRD